MDQTKAKTDDLETMEERNNPISRVGKDGNSKTVVTRRGRRKKPLAYAPLTYDKSSSKQRIFS
jgi:hypothetical protein